MNEPTKEDPIARYYREKTEEAERLSTALEAARKRGAPPSVIRNIERALEMARYVGD